MKRERNDKVIYDGAVIRAAMGAKQFSIRRLAQESGVSHPVITKARQGKDIYTSGLKAICDTLGISLPIGEAKCDN